MEYIKYEFLSTDMLQLRSSEANGPIKITESPRPYGLTISQESANVRTVYPKMQMSRDG